MLNMKTVQIDGINAIIPWSNLNIIQTSYDDTSIRIELLTVLTTVLDIPIIRSF